MRSDEVEAREKFGSFVAAMLVVEVAHISDRPKICLLFVC